MQHQKTTLIGLGEGALVVSVIALLVLTVIGAISAWSIGGSIEIGKHGWIALGLGTFFSLLIGCGLIPVGRSKSPGYGHLNFPHLMIVVIGAEPR
jgi:hypothetical protein